MSNSELWNKKGKVRSNVFSNKFEKAILYIHTSFSDYGDAKKAVFNICFKFLNGNSLGCNLKQRQNKRPIYIMGYDIKKFSYQRNQ